MVSNFTAQSTASRDVLTCIKISEACHTLTGIAPRRCGPSKYRAVATWRGGDGYTVSLDDSKGVWHDPVPDEGGGVLDLIVRVQGGNRAEALRWAADLVGIPLDNKPFTKADRARWAAERRELERALPGARYWRRAAIELSEELLSVLKAALFDGPAEKIDFDGIRDTTRLLARLRRMDGAELVAELHSWMESHPQLTSAMIQSARTRETAERRAIQIYMEMNLVEAERPA